MKTKVFVIIESGMVSGVFSNDNKLDVEIIDLDNVDDETAANEAEKRARFVEGKYHEVA